MLGVSTHDNNCFGVIVDGGGGRRPSTPPSCIELACAPRGTGGAGPQPRSAGVRPPLAHKARPEQPSLASVGGGMLAAGAAFAHPRERPTADARVRPTPIAPASFGN